MKLLSKFIAGFRGAYNAYSDPQVRDPGPEGLLV